MKKLLSVLLTVVFVTGIFTAAILPASARTVSNAYNQLSSAAPARTYTLSSSGITIPYTNKELTTRGTVNGHQNGAYIDNSSDEIYVFSVGKNSKGTMYAYVSYPGSYRRVNAYIKLSDIISSTGTSHVCTTARGKFYLSLRSNSSPNRNYWVDKNDPVFLLSKSSTKAQIMAPRGNGGWRIAWCSVSDYNKYCYETASIPAKSISLNYRNFSTVTMSGSGSTRTLKATLSPANSTDNVKYTSSDTNVATVSSSGVITAVSNGSAIITAKTTSGKTATIKVKCVNCNNWDAKVGKTIASIKNSSGYTKWYGSGNISYRGGYSGQCTWYSYGRFYEITGIKLNTAYHAKYWLSANSSDSRVRVIYGASKIVAKSIAVNTSGRYGHVMFIEHVTYDRYGTPQYVYFTECNYDNNGVYNSGKDCVLQKMTYSRFVSLRNPSGYIVAK